MLVAASVLQVIMAMAVIRLTRVAVREGLRVSEITQRIVRKRGRARERKQRMRQHQQNDPCPRQSTGALVRQEGYCGGESHAVQDIGAYGFKCFARS